MNGPPVKLLELVRNKIRLKHYSIRTIHELPSTCIRKYGHINYLINRNQCAKKSFFICFPLTPEE